MVHRNGGRMGENAAVRTDWSGIDYLKDGTRRQREAHRCLTELRLWERLSAYSPLLAGTIPLDVDIASSDLDVLCEVRGFESFSALLKQSFGHLPGFGIREARVPDELAIVCGFRYGGFEIELFGQNRPTERQNGFVHMIVEYRLLNLAGETAKREIRRLKRSGMKTEPAFARHFGIEGDPYAGLLALERCTDEELRALVAQ